MREIKYRAWSKKEKRIIKVHTLEGTGDKFLFCSDENEKRYCIGVDVELIEYTGLKDKNGKEIYDGDIIYRKDDMGINVKFIVKWDESGWTIEYGTYNMEKECEIIGNIYQNPELLKKGGEKE